MTQQQAIHVCLTHTRNEIIAAETTSTRITYRTPSSRDGGSDSVTVYEGTRPGAAAPIPSQPQHDDAALPGEPSHEMPTAKPVTPADAVALMVVHAEVVAVAAATPTMVAAQPQTPPLTPGMRYRVWHQRLDNADHAYETFDDQFFIQTATLAEAVQLERVLAAYDTWAERTGEHDIEIWDGTAWTSTIDPAALTAAQTFVQRIYHLDDITPTGLNAAEGWESTYA